MVEPSSSATSSAPLVTPPRLVRVVDQTTQTTTLCEPTVLYEGEDFPDTVLAQRDRIVYVEIGRDGAIADLFSLSTAFQVSAAAIAVEDAAPSPTLSAPPPPAPAAIPAPSTPAGTGPGAAAMRTPPLAQVAVLTVTGASARCVRCASPAPSVPPTNAEPDTPYEQTQTHAAGMGGAGRTVARASPARL